MDFKKWVKNMQIAGYNGVHTVGATTAEPVNPVDTSLGIKYTKANALLSDIFTVNLLPKYISYHLSSAFTDSQTVATYIIINRCL